MQPASGSPATPLRGARLFMLIVIAVLVAMLEGFDIQSIAIAAPILAPELGLGAGAVGEIFSIGQAGLVGGAVIGGLLSDRLGRRNALVVGLACFGAFSILTAHGDSYGTLAAARFATGLGIGLSMPNLLTLAAESAPVRHRAKTIAVILAGMSAGGMAVALIGAHFIDALGWRGLFYIGGALPLLVAPFVMMLPNTVPARANKSGGAWRAALFGDRTIVTILLWLSLFLTAATLYMMINWLPSLMRAQGFPLALAHSSSAAFSLGSCLGSITIGVLVDRYDYARVLPPAYLGILAGGTVILLATQASVLIAGAGVFGFFVSGSFFTLNGFAARYYPAGVRGFSTGAAVAIGRLGSIFGPLGGGYVLQYGLGPVSAGPSTVPLAALPLVIVAGVAVVLLTRQGRLEDASPSDFVAASQSPSAAPIPASQPSLQHQR